ncbi:hypothetical protein LWI28_014500 [Acer negundo]|uniref:Uncharacterized protein n=1 Tax=Acer negundo TaxID=4023 RepID=A0AAD5J094_ACENE|nr:hypothetical protein LWI28_014500 [Acer negundo]
MFRKVGASRTVPSSSSRSGSSKSTSGRCFVGSSTRRAFEEREKPGPGELWDGYNYEEFFRDEIDYTRLAINQVRENKMDKDKLARIVVEYLIPTLVGLRILILREQVSNPEGAFAAFHLAFLEICVRLPLQPYIRKVLRQIGIAPVQLKLNAWRIVIGMFALWRSMKYPDRTFTEIGHCYRLYSHKSGGREGGGRAATWERVPVEVLLMTERKHISDTWLVSPERRHVDYLLNDRSFSSGCKEERMADKGKVGADKRKEDKKRRRVIPMGPSLSNEDKASE